jgi:Putative beta-barrel porin 2
MRHHGFALASVLWLCAVSAAHGQLLDSVLPDGIPGYGNSFSVTAPQPDQQITPVPWQFGGVSVAPSVALAGGYDSAPNGAAGSALYSVAPQVLVTDPLLGLGAFASGTLEHYPQDTAQNMSGSALAFGESVVLPRETITLGGGILNAQESGFDIGTIGITTPVPFTVTDLRVSDAIALGQFSLKPEISVTAFRFPDEAVQNRRDDRERATLSYLPGSPLSLVLRLQATQSLYRDQLFNADTEALLVGLVDTADGLWTFSALAGFAQRRPRQGEKLVAPVLESGFDWLPDRLDHVRFTLAREIDDPDAISAVPYTLTQAKFSLRRSTTPETSVQISAEADHAAYLNLPDQETIFSAGGSLSWQLNTILALNASYEFNDRQANFLRAANEHVVTIGATWTQ